MTALAVEGDEALAPPFRGKAISSASVATAMLDEVEKRFEEPDEEA